MTSQVLLAAISAVTTIAVTAGSVLIAYFKLREGQRTIASHTNGLLQAAHEREGKATDALVEIAKTGVDAAIHSPPTEASDS